MPQAKGTAVIRVERDKLVAELPIPVCCSRTEQVICPRDVLVQRMRQQGVDSPELEQGLHEVLEVLGEFTDNDRLGGFSITLPYVSFTPADVRLAAARKLWQTLALIGFEVDVQGSDTIKHEVAAAA
jgi:hypothetical protein